MCSQVVCFNPLPSAASRQLHCLDTYPACPSWTGQCAVPGVAEYCPCMCTGTGGTGGGTGGSGGCVDTYPACPGWAGQCSAPGVSTYCPCMCGAGSGPSPSPSPKPSPSPSPALPKSKLLTICAPFRTGQGLGKRMDGSTLPDRLQAALRLLQSDLILSFMC